MTKDNRGGAGRGQGRKPLPEELVAKTVTLFTRQVEALKRANLSEVVRRLIDDEHARQAKRYVTLWEDNAGGCWLVDKERTIAWDMSGGTSFVTDAADMFIDGHRHWDGESYSYEKAIENDEAVSMVADWDGDCARLYVNEMGYGAREYCRVPTDD